MGEGIRRVVAGEFIRDRPADGTGDAGHRTDEVFDHPVRVRVVDVEPVELAVGREIDPRLPLDVEDDARGVDDRLLAGEGSEPIRDRVRSDRGREDTWLGTFGSHGERKQSSHIGIALRGVRGGLSPGRGRASRKTRGRLWSKRV